MLGSGVTRGTLSFAASRLSRVPIEVVYLDKSERDDGSYSTKDRVELTKGFLTNLTDSDIERVREGGQTITSGAFVTLPYEIPEVPYEFRAAYSRYRPVKYSIAQGISVFTCERHSIGEAVVEADA